MHHLHFNGLGKHLVERSWGGGVHEHTGVPWLAREPILQFEAIVAIARIGNQVSLRLA